MSPVLPEWLLGWFALVGQLTMVIVLLLVIRNALRRLRWGYAEWARWRDDATERGLHDLEQLRDELRRVNKLLAKRGRS